MAALAAQSAMLRLWKMTASLNAFLGPFCGQKWQAWLTFHGLSISIWLPNASVRNWAVIFRLNMKTWFPELFVWVILRGIILIFLYLALLPWPCFAMQPRPCAHTPSMCRHLPLWSVAWERNDHNGHVTFWCLMEMQLSYSYYMVLNGIEWYNMVSWYYMVLHGIITVHLLRSRGTNITNVAHTKKTKRPAVESASTLSLNHALGWHLDNHDSQHWFNKNRFPYTELVVALNSPTQRTARISTPATSKKLGLRGRGRPTPLASSRSRGSQCARHHVAERIELHRVCKIKAMMNRYEGWIPKLM